MSKNIHSLFLTRGVPGTHDLSLLNNTIRKLKQKKFKTVSIPKFDKSIDDRSQKYRWQKIKHKPHIIIFEGWCIGAIHQRNVELRKPLNQIEKEYDTDLKWRRTVNNLIKNQYKKLFSKIDFPYLFASFGIKRHKVIPYTTNVKILAVIDRCRTNPTTIFSRKKRNSH